MAVYLAHAISHGKCDLRPVNKASLRRRNPDLISVNPDFIGTLPLSYAGSFAPVYVAQSAKSGMCARALQRTRWHVPATLAHYTRPSGLRNHVKTVVIFVADRSVAQAIPNYSHGGASTSDNCKYKQHVTLRSIRYTSKNRAGLSIDGVSAAPFRLLFTRREEYGSVQYVNMSILCGFAAISDRVDKKKRPWKGRESTAMDSN